METGPVFVQEIFPGTWAADGLEQFKLNIAELPTDDLGLRLSRRAVICRLGQFVSGSDVILFGISSPKTSL
jgi:hypothetical protein